VFISRRTYVTRNSKTTGWATRYEVPSGTMMGFFLIAVASRPALGTTHPPSYPMSTGSWMWPLTSILVPSLRMRGDISPLSHTFSWCGA